MTSLRALRSSLTVLLLLLLLFLAALRLIPAEQQFIRSIESNPEVPTHLLTQEAQPTTTEVGTVDSSDTCAELVTVDP